MPSARTKTVTRRRHSGHCHITIFKGLWFDTSSFENKSFFTDIKVEKYEKEKEDYDRKYDQTCQSRNKSVPLFLLFNNSVHAFKKSMSETGNLCSDGTVVIVISFFPMVPSSILQFSKRKVFFIVRQCLTKNLSSRLSSNGKALKKSGNSLCN